MESSHLGAGLPLLSGVPPSNDRPGETESSCRRCNKEFNIIFTRGRKCNHCGYTYCSSCTDFQALLPRSDGQAGVNGYEPVNVCAFCIEMLNITASNRPRLRTLPLSKLRKYMKAYDIKSPPTAIEKDDLIDIVINARGPNGCLPPENEMYYRLHAIQPPRSPERPSASSRARNLFNRATSSATSSPPTMTPPTPSPIPPRYNPPPVNSQFRPPSVPPREQPYTPRRPPVPPPGPPGHPSYAPPPGHPPIPPRYHSPRPPSHVGPGVPLPPRPTQTHAYAAPRSPPPPPRQRPVPPPAPARSPDPPPPPPSLDQLLLMSSTDLSKLTIHALKSILFANHVNAAHAVEKSELVDRVSILIEQERSERIAAQQRQEEEEREARERAQRETEERLRKKREVLEARDRERQQQADSSDVTVDHDAPPKAEPGPSPQPSFNSLSERNGLCVICQDEDANIAVVDCGHLCLCRGCSEIVMKSTRECPMCRTRIITEARLLRIFKT